jgi:hypothetical protein
MTTILIMYFLQKYDHNKSCIFFNTLATPNFRALITLYGITDSRILKVHRWGGKTFIPSLMKIQLVQKTSSCGSTTPYITFQEQFGYWSISVEVRGRCNINVNAKFSIKNKIQMQISVSVLRVTGLV